MKKVLREYRIQQIKKNIPAILLVTVLTFIGLFSVLNRNYEDSYLVTGLVESITGLPDDTGDKLYMLVRLDDSSLVRSRIKRSTMYKQGRVVELTVIEPRFFGRTVYRFRGYVEESLSKQ